MLIVSPLFPGGQQVAFAGFSERSVSRQINQISIDSLGLTPGIDVNRCKNPVITVRSHPYY
jgi:hypothetical protein